MRISPLLSVRANDASGECGKTIAIVRHRELPENLRE